MGYKIRDAQTMKIPYQIIVGDNEIDSETINVRAYGADDSSAQSVESFLDDVEISKV